MTNTGPIIDAKLEWSARNGLADVYPALKPRLDLETRETVVLQFPLWELQQIYDSLVPIALTCKDKRFRISSVVPATLGLAYALNKYDPDAFDNVSGEPARQPVPPDFKLEVQLTAEQRIAMSALFPDWTSIWKVSEEGLLTIRFSAVRFQSVRDSLIPYAISCGNEVMQQNLTEAFVKMWDAFPICDIYTNG